MPNENKNRSKKEKRKKKGKKNDRGSKKMQRRSVFGKKIPRDQWRQYI